MTRVVLVFVLACGGTTTPDLTTPASNDFDELHAQWESRGMQVLREGDAFVEPGGRYTMPVQVGPECTLVFAVASAGIGDLDSVLYSPEGEVLAEDVEPDARPLVRYCGPVRRAYFVAHAYAGQGSFRFVVASGTREHMDWIAESVGGAPPIGGSASASLERTLRARGFQRMVDRRRIQLVDGEDVRFPIALRAHECVTVLANSESPVRLSLESSAGRVEAVEGPQNGVQVCDVQEAVGILRGRGLAQVVVLAGTSADVGGPAALWMGETRNAQTAGEGDMWVLEPAEVRELRPEGCQTFEAHVEQGSAVLTLRSGGDALARGARVRGEVCERGALVTSAPARVRWRWIP